MRLGINEINEGIYEAAIAKTIRQLTKEKFEVIRDYRIENVEISPLQVDLFAFNSYEKRIYEFKIGRNRIQRKQFERLQHYARQIGARLFVIYLEVPSSKRIYFNHIEPIIHRDMENKRPEELFDIVHGVEIKHIENVDIEFAEIDDELVNLRGKGTVVVDVGKGKFENFDQSDNGEFVEFDFSFRLKLDVSQKVILLSYYRFDTSWFEE